MTEATLPYESRVGGPLEPGETVLWDGEPEPIPPKGITASTIIALVVLAALGVAAGMFDGSMPLVAVFAIGFGIMALIAMNDVFGGADRTPTCTHRVTDRRMIRTQPNATPAMTQVHARDLVEVSLRRDKRGRAFVKFGGAGADEPGEATVTFERVADPHALLRLTLPLPARQNRRVKFRRGGGRATAPPRSATVSAVDDTRAPLPDDVRLLDGEVILWRGAPRRWDRIGARWILGKLLILALLAIPIGILLAATGQLGPRLHVWHWLPTAAAVIWLWLGVYSVAISPFRDAARRGRTRYYLTNVRAIIYEGGRTSVTRSVLLDMAGAVHLDEERDGTGFVRMEIGGGFERIDNAAEVYRLVIEAIRATGGPASHALASAEQPQHVGGGGLQ